MMIIVYAHLPGKKAVFKTFITDSIESIERCCRERGWSVLVIDMIERIDLEKEVLH